MIDGYSRWFSWVLNPMLRRRGILLAVVLGWLGVPASAAASVPPDAQRQINAAVTALRQKGFTEKDVTTLMNRLSSSGLSSDHTETILRGLDKARAPGVSTKLLIDKTIEGVAKHIPPGRLVPALKSYGLRLHKTGAFADDLLASSRTQLSGRQISRDDAVLRIIGVIDRGVSEDALTQILEHEKQREGREQASPQMVMIALESYADFMEQHVSSAQAMEIIAFGLGHHWTDDDFKHVTGSLTVMAQTTSSEQAARSLLKSLQRGKTPTKITHDVRRRDVTDSVERLNNERKRKKETIDQGKSRIDRPGPPKSAKKDKTEGAGKQK